MIPVQLQQRWDRAAEQVDALVLRLGALEAELAELRARVNKEQPVVSPYDLSRARDCTPPEILRICKLVTWSKPRKPYTRKKPTDEPEEAHAHA